MSIRKIAIAALVASSSVVAVPVVAQASKARHTSVAKVIAVRKSASHAGDAGTLIIGGLGLAAVVGGIVAISGSNNPSSP